MAFTIKKPAKPGSLPPKNLQAPKKLQTSAKPVAKASSGGVSARYEGFGRARQIAAEGERRREESKNRPFSFRLGIGEEKEIILLDDKPFFLYLHQWESSPGKYNNIERCIKEKEPCPLCQQLGKESSYVLMLSCIDKTPFTDRKGVEHKSSKKLLPIKTGMIMKYERLLNDNGTWRGLKVKVARDGGKTSASSGDYVSVISKLTPEQLAKYGEKSQVVDYEKAYPMLSAADMNAKWKIGGGKPIGSDDIPFDADESAEEDWDA